MGTIVAILQVPAVAGLVQSLTGKLFGNRGVDTKVTAAVAPGVVLTILLLVVKQFDPGLGAILEGNEEVLIGAIALVSAVIAYYTPAE
jgi:hypothetical protein